jgi:carbon starvation protein
MSATFTAGYVKIFDPDPKMGFISAAKLYAGKLATGGTPGEVKEWAAQRFNMQVDTVVTAFFLVAVAVIFLGCLREWVALLRGTKQSVLRESAYVPLPEAA